MQLTFVLQSFQQLRSVYGEDIEKIIRANSSNTIFLKSNDEELVNELVRLSGVKHDFRVKSKSVSQKMGDVITVSEPIINYSGEQIETTALTANDLLFLAGPSPGNSVTFSSGEMAIVNKLDTITPMAAGLHKRLPQPASGQYSDSTMPATKAGDSINFLDNIIDGDKLVQDRVAQAKIAQEVKEVVLKIASDNGVMINERTGELADVMMNIVYEEFEKRAGETRANLSQPVSYHEIATRMMNNVMLVKDKDASSDDKLKAAQSLKEDLVRCVMDSNLDELTEMYRDKHSQIIIGYDPVSVSKFVTKFKQTYPAPKKLEFDNVDVFDQAAKTASVTGYKEYDDGNNLLFDTVNFRHTDAFNDVIMDMIERNLVIPGVSLNSRTNEDGGDDYVVYIDGQKVADFVQMVGEDGPIDEYQADLIGDRNLVTKLVTENKQLLSHITSRMNDDY